MGNEIDGVDALLLGDGSAADTPPAGKVALYAVGGAAFTKDDQGVEISLGGGGTVPTPDSWGVETQTTSVPTLTDSSPTVQLLLGTVTRVNMPAFSAANPFFVLVNNSINDIAIRPSVGSDFTLRAGHVAQLFSDGVSAWSASSSETITNKGLVCYWYGGNDSVAPNQFLEASGDVSANLGSAQDLSTQWTMPTSGQLRAIGSTGANPNDPDYAVYKNGVLSESTPSNALFDTDYSFGGFVSTFLEGDKLSVTQTDGNGEVGNCRVVLLVDLIGVGAVLDFNGSLNVNAFVIPNENYDDFTNVTVYDEVLHAFMLPVAVSLTAIKFNTTSAQTVSGNVYKNGVIDQAYIPLIATEGTDVLVDTAYAVGDTVAFRPYLSGVNPGSSRWQFLFRGLTGTAFFRWGGNTTVLNRWKRSYYRANLAVNDSTPNYLNNVVMPSAGSVEACSVLRQATVTQDAGLGKNGVLSEGISVGTNDGVDTNMATTFVGGDTLSVFGHTNNPPEGFGNYLLAARF